MKSMGHTAFLRDQDWEEGTVPLEAVILCCSLARIGSATASERDYPVRIRFIQPRQTYLAAICSDEFDL
jgi:hypothetical protein